jgi:hypothetical protein
LRAGAISGAAVLAMKGSLQGDGAE